MEKVTISWLGERRFDVVGASLEELSPKELLLLAVSKCAALTALALFEKMQIPVTSLDVESAAELTGPAEISYNVFTSIRQTFRVGVPAAADHPRVLHALKLTHEKYCGVGLMLAKAAPLSYEVLINNHPAV